MVIITTVSRYDVISNLILPPLFQLQHGLVIIIITKNYSFNFRFVIIIIIIIIIIINFIVPQLHRKGGLKFKIRYP